MFNSGILIQTPCMLSQICGHQSQSVAGHLVSFHHHNHKCHHNHKLWILHYMVNCKLNTKLLISYDVRMYLGKTNHVLFSVVTVSHISSLHQLNLQTLWKEEEQILKTNSRLNWYLVCIFITILHFLFRSRYGWW